MSKYDVDCDLIDLLQNIQDCLDGYQDVDDGDYGTQVPNRAMRLYGEIEAVLKTIVDLENV